MSLKSLPQFDGISTEILSNSLIVRFVRPNIRNPLSIAVQENLRSIIDAADGETDFDKIIFTGQADVFAAGADLREIARILPENARTFAVRGQDLMNKIADSRKLTIAAVNGFCFGGALDLALACQKRIAAAHSSFSHPGANLGIITGWGGTQRLPRLIGEAMALEMFLTAKIVDANKALRIKLIDEISKNPLLRALEINEKIT